jgi:hypothetical protein
MRDSANHLYEELQNIRITYVPAADRTEKNNWAGSDVIRIQSHKGEKGNALHMGAELPIKNPDVFVEMIAKLCTVYHAGRSKRK